MIEPLYLIDGYGLIYRSYFAFMNKPLFNPEGKNSSAVYGFFRALFQLIGLKNPSYLAVIMDSRVPTFRHEKYPAYKANREKAPEDLHAQVPVIEQILKALGITSLMKDGFEADDLIATLSARCQKENRDCYILSGDKDILQVVGNGVFVLNTPKGSSKFDTLGREEVFEARGIYPEQVVDYLALTGDQSDNIPGVPGVGKKTALELLSQYADLEAIYKNLEAVRPEGLKKKLVSGRENAFLSRELVMLRKDVPLSIDIKSLGIHSLKKEEAIPLFARQGMKNLVEELGGKIEEIRPLRQLKSGSHETILDESALGRWIGEAKKKKLFAFDTETNSLDEMKADPLGFSLATEAGKACYIPIKAVDVDPLPNDVVFRSLKGLLEDPDLLLIGQNIKYDFKVMQRWGITIKNRLFDTMIAAWLIDSEYFSFSMDALALKYLQYKTIHYKDVVGKEQKRTLADVDIVQATDYSAEDADITYQLFEVFSDKLKEEGLTRIFHDLEMPLIRILAYMELTGIRLDCEQLLSYRRELKEQLDEIEEEIFILCGRRFNIRSTRELQYVLFEERKLKPVKKTKTGKFSTDNYVLEELAREDEVPEKVLKHRLMTKLKSTYVDALPLLVNPTTRRLHTHYRQTGAATGRLSSVDPNLQNIPVREESGRRIRSAFIPEEGFTFLSADYSQIELVVLAHLSQDEMLIKAFREGRDIHRQTAGIIFDIPEQEVTQAQRRIGKTINFGVIYGMSSFRLARDLKLGRKEADEFISRYFQRYSGVRRFKDQTIRKAEADGYVETFMGRRRSLLYINSRNKTEKMAAERVAVNSPIQGGAADIVKRAMLNVTHRLLEEGLEARLLLQVHDELIFEVKEEKAAEVQEIVKAAMENAVSLSLPLMVKIEIGKSWGDIH